VLGSIPPTPTPIHSQFEARERVGANVSHVNHRRLLKTEEAADICGESAKTFRNRRAKGEGAPFIRLSRRAVRYDPEDIERWLASRRVDPGKPAA
jgi:predicted DNA-binding transcriptional regulator AlpA